MGWFEGISTRTPTTSSSRTPSPYLPYRAGATGPGTLEIDLRGSGRRALQGAGDQGGVQPHAQRGDLPGRLVRKPGRLRPALATQRRHDLLDQARLAVRRGPER